VVWVTLFVFDVAKGTIREFGNASFHEVVEVEGNRAIRSDSPFGTKFFFVWGYRGNVVTPKWMDIDTENYTILCIIEVDLSQVPIRPQPKATGNGTFYKVDYDIILLFGMTEFIAQVAWYENGIEKRSPTKIIYEPDSEATTT